MVDVDGDFVGFALGDVEGTGLVGDMVGVSLGLEVGL
jgi:hypothetical protein